VLRIAIERKIAQLSMLFGQSFIRSRHYIFPQLWITSAVTGKIGRNIIAGKHFTAVTGPPLFKKALNLQL
jgi:hypothetical protein